MFLKGVYLNEPVLKLVWVDSIKYYWNLKGVLRRSFV